MKKIITLICFFMIIGLLRACNYFSNGDISSTETINNDLSYSSSNSDDERLISEVSNQEEKETKDINSLIPDGWHIFEQIKGEPVKVEGDLNKDNILDIAAVIEKNTSVNESEAPPRSLLIAFGNNDNTYSLSIIADNVILSADEGGVFGDPFDSLKIDRGSIVVSDYGGSNWRWYNKYRFRYQANDWYLIGVTMGSYFTGNTTMDNADEEDYNLLTGDYIIKRTDENGKRKVTNGNRGINPLVKLKDFNIENM
ncbi:hypothetical protein [Clostridium formicaceticum]|uniref:Uncharacterized protein n=1 Tax=Clostridium formicaceticum TaxID=1497 RepID=A0AAC9RKH3_9CLOT|nr:hypothetical protein [Clostridium formicaceticum]AOY76772.1 hypothetical protein BJL90_13465 [Clostridium formicaceticum]ARE87227.1 hypothetical protein CLFO_16260 [Clostridium formicaceticum]